MRARLAWPLALLLAIAAPGAAQEPEACTADSDLEYLCGPEKPEDLLALPGTPWLITSGFAPGAGLKLVDTRSRTARRWYGGGAQARWDRKAYPHCPGPLDPALSNARGLSLRQTGPARWQLLVVNHGGREAIKRLKCEPAPPRRS